MPCEDIRDIEGRCLCGYRGRHGSYAATDQGMLGAPENGGGKEGSACRSFKRRRVLPRP